MLPQNTIHSNAAIHSFSNSGLFRLICALKKRSECEPHSMASRKMQYATNGVIQLRSFICYVKYRTYKLKGVKSRSSGKWIYWFMHCMCKGSCCYWTVLVLVLPHTLKTREHQTISCTLASGSVVKIHNAFLHPTRPFLPAYTHTHARTQGKVLGHITIGRCIRRISGNL